MEDNDFDLLVAHQAAANGELETLSQAIQSDPALLEHQDNDGLTPLGYAVKAEQLEAVKILVKMGASINAQDNIGRTCLSVAAYQGWYEGVRFLLRNGASQSICDKTGRSPLHTATYCMDANVLKLLLQNLGSVNITQTDDEDMTPLHWAAFHCRVPHVKLLIERGTNVSLQDVDGKTALHWAAQNGCHECCRWLLEADNGRDTINCRDNSDKTALHLAAAAGHPAVLTVLAETDGCELDAEDNDGRTPLHWAAAMGRTETLNILLNLGVDPVPADVQGNTPLDYARQSGHNDCVEALEKRLGLRKTGVRLSPEEGRTRAKKTTKRGGFFTDFFRLKRDAEPSSGRRSASRSLGGGTDAGPGFEDSADCRRNSEVDFDLVASQRPLPPSRKPDHERLLVESIARLRLSRRDYPTDVRSPPPLDPDRAQFVWSPPSPAPPPQQEHQQRQTTGRGRDRLGSDSPPIDCGQGRSGPSYTPTEPDTGRRPWRAPPGGRDSIQQSAFIPPPPPQSPPMFRRDRSLSPGSSPMSLRIEANRAQLEEDAAQILALQLNKGQQKLSPSQGAKSPRPLDPIVSPRGGAALSDQSTNVSSGSSGTAEVDGSREAVPEIRHGASQLAPIRGSLPKVAGPNVNKRLHLLRQEKSGANRSPTPPGWSNLQQNCLPSGMRPTDLADDNEAFPGHSLHHQKKNKKKSRLLQTRGQQALTQQTNTSPQDPERLGDDNKADDKLEALTPRLGAVSKVRDAKEQIAFNRNVQTLLH